MLPSPTTVFALREAFSRRLTRPELVAKLRELHPEFTNIHFTSVDRYIDLMIEDGLVEDRDGIIVVTHLGQQAIGSSE